MSFLTSTIYRKIVLDLNSTCKRFPIASIYKKVPCYHTSVVLFYKQNTGSNNSKEKYKGSLWQWLSVSGLFVGLLTIKIYFQTCLVNAAEIDPTSSIYQPVKGGSGGSSKRTAFNFVADVVDIVGNAVVYIERQQRIPFVNQAIPVSNGSGFIVDKNGLIITNAHVVGNQSSLKVKLPDGREFNGQVVGIDESKDIAAVRIDGRNLPVIALGSTRDLRPGEWVVAIGSPLALKNTVTAGIVSNLCRAGKELGLHDREKRDMEYIQTDATITVGNSGGPLVNLDGEVIGINTMMASAGIGFAIPIDCVKDFLHTLQQGHGQRSSSISHRRWIGITMLTLTPDIAMQLRMKNRSFPADINAGVFVHRVQFDSPAYLAGMQDGDVIVRINETGIMSTKDVMNSLKRSQVLNVTVRRGERTVVLRIVAEEVVH